MLCLHHIGCLKVEVKLECPPAFVEVMVDADNKLFDKIAWYSNLMRMGPTTPASSFPARVHPEVTNMDQAIVYCFDHFLWNVLGPSAIDDRWPPSRKDEAGETDLAVIALPGNGQTRPNTSFRVSYVGVGLLYKYILGPYC